jgi:hypothetical protein
VQAYQTSTELLSTRCRAAAFFSASGAALRRKFPTVKSMSNQPALLTPDIKICVFSGCDAVQLVRSFGGIFCLHRQSERVSVSCYLLLLITWFAHSSTLNIKVVCFSKTSANFYQTVRLHSSEDSILHLSYYICVRDKVHNICEVFIIKKLCTIYSMTMPDESSVLQSK